MIAIKPAKILPCLALLLATGNVAAATVPEDVRRDELLNLIRHDCGSCHGLTLAGGLGLPLLPEALKGKHPDALKETILRGRGGTPMPPWQDFISEEEAKWIVDLLMKGIPDAK
jgi:cytochrome c55X